MHCPKCQTWNPEHFNFCLECGHHFGPTSPRHPRRETPSGLRTVRGQLRSSSADPSLVAARRSAAPVADDPLWLTMIAASLTTFVFVAALLVLLS